MRPVMLLFFAILLSITPALAQTEEEYAAAAEAFESSLGYQTGTVTLPDGIATINVPADFRYLGKEGSQRLLTDGWGNPAEMSEHVLGMLVPANISPLADEGWGIIITFDDSGYVSDKDAASIDYEKLLKQMQDGTKVSNKEREKLGFEPVTLIGWAEAPHYDAANHKLYWAKELQFGSADVHTLNYCIRVLGRRGVLELNAVSAMDRLPTIHDNTDNVLASIDFNQGHRYTDYVHGEDKVAEYGLAALIAGAAAAKVGFFKALLVAILALKKLLVVAVLALVAFARKLFMRREKTPAQARPA